MKGTMKRRFLIPLALGTLALGTGLVAAQAFGGRGGFGDRPGHSAQARGPVTIAIYAQAPDSGAAPFETLTLDRPLSPGEIIANYPEATFVVMSGDSFSRTIELAALAVEVSIYAEDPAAGAEPLVTATLPEPSGLRDLIAETDGAAFVVVVGDDFSRTIDLSRAEAGRQQFRDRQGPGRHGDRRGPGGNDGRRDFRNQRDGPRGFAPQQGFGAFGSLDEGESITVTLFEGDPAVGGSVLQTLTFTAGEDDRVGFLTELREAAAGATHMQLGDDGRVVELGRGFGPRGFRGN